MLVLNFEFEWGCYAMSASKAIFRARTYNCGGVRPFQPLRPYSGREHTQSSYLFGPVMMTMNTNTK